MTAEQLNEIVVAAVPHSDGGAARLAWYAEQFVAAHRGLPGGPVLEIGTRAGGSAYLWLRLLDALYGTEHEPPMVVTVDPYGDRPYHDGVGIGHYGYGGTIYCEQKLLLAPFPNHMHFRLPSRDWFRTIAAADPILAYWQDGLSRPFRGFSFVFLDGEHDATTIGAELAACFATMDFLRPGARVCIDNADHDRRTRLMLEAEYELLHSAFEFGAVTVTGRRAMARGVVYFADGTAVVA